VLYRGGDAIDGGGGGGGGYFGGGSGGPGYTRNFEGAGGGGGGSSFTSQLVTDIARGRSTDPASVTIYYEDNTAPVVSIDSPAYAERTFQRPTFSGRAGRVTGDSGQVALTVYSGATPDSANQVYTGKVDVDSTGMWSQQVPRLTPGIYVAVARQSDIAGNTGDSGRLVFAVDADPVVPDPPTGPQNPPTGPQNPPVGPQNPPVGPQNPPVGPQNPPVGPQNPPVDPQNPQDPQAQQQSPTGDNGNPQTTPAPQSPAMPRSPGAQKALGLSVARQRLSRVLRSGLVVGLRCNGACPARIRVLVPAKVAKRYGLGNGRADVVIASTRTSGARTVLRISARARRALAKARSLPVRIEASSATAATATRAANLIR
jgi:hypothetical protein